MSEKQISREEEVHVEMLEDEVEDIYNEDELVCGHCCKTMLTEELETRDRIRSVVLPGTMIYNATDIRRFMMFLSMYPAFATVSEVVEDMTAHYEESEID